MLRPAGADGKLPRAVRHSARDRRDGHGNGRGCGAAGPAAERNAKNEAATAKRCAPPRKKRKLTVKRRGQTQMREFFKDLLASISVY